MKTYKTKQRHNLSLRAEIRTSRLIHTSLARTLCSICVLLRRENHDDLQVVMLSYKFQVLIIPPSNHSIAFFLFKFFDCETILDWLINRQMFDTSVIQSFGRVLKANSNRFYRFSLLAFIKMGISSRCVVATSIFELPFNLNISKQFDWNSKLRLHL